MDIQSIINSVKNLPWKKIGLSFGLLAVSIGIALAIYYVFFRQAPTTVIQPPTGGGAGLPQAGTGKPPVITPPGGQVLPPAGGVPTIKVPGEVVPKAASLIAQGGITQVKTIDANINFGTRLAGDKKNVVSFDRTNGKFYTTTAAGQKIPLSDKTFFDVQSVNWGNKTEKAIMEFPDGSNILYDFKQDKQYTLPQSWTEFSFTANDDKIAFKEVSNDPARNWLSMASPDGSSKVKIEAMGSNGDGVDVNVSPTGQVVALYTEIGGTDRSTVYLIGQNGENFKGLAVKGMGFQSSWSPDGEKLVYSVYSDATNYKPELWITDAYGNSIGQNNQSLQLNTWSYKCAFQNTDYMYCGVPAYLDTGAGLQPTLSDYIPDNIYKIDLKTGAKSVVAIPEESTTVGSMAVSEDGTNLYITDKNTQNIKTIRLK